LALPARSGAGQVHGNPHCRRIRVDAARPRGLRSWKSLVRFDLPAVPVRHALAAFVFGLAGASVVSVAPALAQAWPSKPIRWIVPFPPGGGNDTVARAVGQRLAEAVGQPVNIDNRPGAGGTIGADLAARAPADGYTLFLAGVASHGINPALGGKLPYDPVRDFTPVSLLATAPLLLVVHPSLPVKSVKDLVVLARARPGTLNYASNGRGSSSHMATELFASLAQVKMEHVPYKGFAPALQDLLAGRVELMFSSVVAILPHVSTGKLRPVATSGAVRSPVVPNLPTVAESGLAGYETASWYGVVAPSGTPAAVVERLASELGRIVRLPAMREQLLTDGAVPVGSTPQAFAAHIKAELARWAKLVREAKIQADS
jgi:tripartite-type tricarboxylate transporter receptor subunit TctC